MSIIYKTITMIFVAGILCFIILFYFIHWYYNSSVIENLVTTPNIAVDKGELIDIQSNYIDSIYLNKYSEKLSDLISKISKLRSTINDKKLSEFMKVISKYKEPISQTLIGVKNESEIFTITTTSEGALSNTINIEVPVGQKGLPGPPGDQGEKGEKGEKGPIGETGNCGSVLN
jgi:hypothetical protein